MTLGERLTDPTDLDGLREKLSASDPGGRLAPLGMERIEIGSGVLDLLPEVVSGLLTDGGEADGRRGVLVTDGTPVPRRGEELKASSRGCSPRTSRSSGPS